MPTLHSEEGEGKDEGREFREESSERDGEQTQSRSNRWKAKHEAMLKQAGEEGKGSSQQVCGDPAGVYWPARGCRPREISV